MNNAEVLQAELRDLTARRDIGSVVQQYMRGLDRLNADLVSEAFTGDAWLDMGVYTGSAAAFVPFAMELLATFTGTQHFIGQHTIELHGADTASGEVFFQAWHGTKDSGELENLFVTGRYVDEYTLQNGQWRIHRRKLITDWTGRFASEPAFLSNPETVNLAGRSGQDFSETRNWPE